MGKSVKILVVDDESDFRQVMKMWLESKGYEVVSAATAREGIDLVKSSKPDLVFMDIRMPEMDGVDAVKAIRRFDRSTPIIIISAYVEEPKVKEIRPSEISGIFFKNDDFEKGASLLESALRMHKRLGR